MHASDVTSPTHSGVLSTLPVGIINELLTSATNSFTNPTLQSECYV